MARSSRCGRPGITHGCTLTLVLFPTWAIGQTIPPQVRVPDRQANANVHMGPTSSQPVLVLVPKGTVLPVLKKQGEWFLVQLAPELRKLGTPMRWYKNETQGWVHESTVDAAPPPARSKR